MSCAYIIITPAFNEARYIEITIKSVLAQTVLPRLWVIVDDGSTDATADIIKKYAQHYPWIKYIHREKDPGRMYFANNVFAIEKGIREITNCELTANQFDYIAILDADISLPCDYYSIILDRLEQDEKLGIASGIYENLVDGRLQPVLNDRRSTPKAIMVFRRKCYEDIGGFLPLQYGGEDTAACVMARMKNWKVWSYPDVKVVHHRPTGTGNTRNIMAVRFRQGICEYCLAAHPLFFFIKTLKRAIKEKPYIIGGFARLVGYLWAAMNRYDSILPPAVVKYIRKEQLDRVFKLNVIPEQDRSACQ